MNVIENNKLIAKFMGFINVTPNDPFFNVYENTEGDIIEIRSAEYHSSWDWLIPVVEKIENTDEEYDVRILGQSAEVITYEGDIIIEMITSPTKIESVYKTVVEFIKWYNKK